MSPVLKSMNITEATWTEADLINAIMGAVDGDNAKMRKALGALKKGQLKKVYGAATGASAEQVNAEVGGDDDDDGYESDDD